MSVEKMEFKTELKQLLHLITHSLYSNRDIFLRELISNASDAINKMKFDSLANEDLLEGNKDWKIKLTADATANTLTISDNGIGMTRETIVELLGTIAKSGTKAFMEAAKQQSAQDPGLIGQFGVGFYSAFMVADKVKVISRAAGAGAQGVAWESDGQGEFTVSEAEKPSRGTDVILYLKEDAKKYLSQYEIEDLIKKYSDYVEHPIVMDAVEGEGEEKTTVERNLNTQTALWLRHPKEIKAEEYDAFYQQISGDFEKPARVIHYGTEGNNEFKALAFIPGQRPASYQWEEPKGLKLYIQRVLIMDSCEGLLPEYLRFVRGVVDSSDLPLNISRELLQNNPLLEKIQKNIVRNVLEGLEALKNVEEEKYIKFFESMGGFIKEGAARDWANREKLLDLILFQSTTTAEGKFTTLGEYVSRMPDDQKDIYYLIGDSKAFLVNSPLVESYKAKGWEVLLLTENVDEYLMPQIREFKGKSLKAVDRSDTAAPEQEEHADAEIFKPFLDHLKTKIDEVKDIRLSKRLTSSASVLVADAEAMTANLERVLKRMGRLDEQTKRTLELNPTHPLVLGLKNLYQQNADDPKIESIGRLLYEQAVITEGSKLNDPAGFTKRINDLLTSSLA